MSSPTSTGQVVGDENGANPRERRWRGPADARVDRARRQTRPGTSTPALRCPVVATGRVRGDAGGDSHVVPRRDSEAAGVDPKRDGQVLHGRGNAGPSRRALRAGRRVVTLIIEAAVCGDLAAFVAYLKIQRDGSVVRLRREFRQAIASIEDRPRIHPLAEDECPGWEVRECHIERFRQRLLGGRRRKPSSRGGRRFSAGST